MSKLTRKEFEMLIKRLSIIKNKKVKTISDICEFIDSKELNNTITIDGKIGDKFRSKVSIEDLIALAIWNQDCVSRRGFINSDDTFHIFIQK